MTSEVWLQLRKASLWKRQKKILAKARKEKLPIVDKDFNLKGLITIKDIEKQIKIPAFSEGRAGTSSLWSCSWNYSKLSGTSRCTRESEGRRCCYGFCTWTFCKCNQNSFVWSKEKISGFTGNRRKCCNRRGYKSIDWGRRWRSEGGVSDLDLSVQHVLLQELVFRRLQQWWIAMKLQKNMAFRSSLMEVSNIQEIWQKQLRQEQMYVWWEVSSQDVMRAQEHLNYSREENTKYTVEWDPSQPWRTEAKTVTSRPAPRNWFRKVWKAVQHTKARRGHCIPADRRTSFRYGLLRSERCWDLKGDRKICEDFRSILKRVPSAWYPHHQRGSELQRGWIKIG